MDHVLSAAEVRAAGWPKETIDHAVRRHAAERPDELAVVGPTASLTWRELDAAAGRAAAIIRATGGPAPRVAWFGTNDVGYLVSLLGAWRSRGGLVGLNWRLTDGDLAAAAQEAGVTHIFTSAAFADRAAALAADGVHVEVVDQTVSNPWPDLEPAEPLEPEYDDLGFVFFTSGSTGVPKSVPQDRLAVEIGASTPVVHRFTTDSRLLIIPPVFHLAGTYWAQYGLLYGARQTYIDNPSPQGIVAAMAEHGITHAVYVPTLIRAIVDELRARPVPLPALRHIAYGASPITVSLLSEALEVIGCEFCQVMGMTEAGGVVSYLPPADHLIEGPHAHRLASAGRCTVGVELEVREPGIGTPLPAGASGELWFRTPFMANHYIGRPEQTAKVFVDGWINSRDIGHVDADGYIYMEGRSDDMIITGGENVHPGEVEGVIAELPDVVESAVFGVPDPLWGRKVAALVVSRSGNLDAAQVVEHCRGRLAGYKIPKTVVFLDELPKTATGKIVRSALPDTLAAIEETA
jgi:acyl-CoA synthetase (AMP-forming)/AMP-acid ligase II